VSGQLHVPHRFTARKKASGTHWKVAIRRTEKQKLSTKLGKGRMHDYNGRRGRNWLRVNE
jgi:hypothetical protein